MPEEDNQTDRSYRALPSIHVLLESSSDLVAAEGRPRVVDALRRALDDARAAIRAGAPAPDAEQLMAQARLDLLPSSVVRSSSPLINATGVIIHTNLGRAVLSRAAQEAMLSVASDYSPLEFDLETGERGRRGGAVERLVCDLTGAEAALVVNNCASATLLMLSALARGKGVVISRGQLVEIGGGFRIPDILRQSGAELIEVGTTNRTRLSDYEQALGAGTGAILRVHSSNFKMVGFTQEVAVGELVELARTMAQPVLDDIGSGALVDMAQFGLSHEPMPQESVRAGAAVVVFSGDKLLGGPQAGIMAGQKDYIERCRRHPLARAVRADKYTLAALGATLLHYARGEAVREVPVLRMIALTKLEIERRAESARAVLASWAGMNGIELRLDDGWSTIGGGSLPGETLPTKLLALVAERPDEVAARLRRAPVPVIARIRDQRVLLDLRTVLDDQALITSVVESAQQR